jgi:4-amino-4-deoxy-L-arabinose transferase-like glycosyltransferase
MRLGANWKFAGIVVLVAFAVRAAIFLHLNGFDIESHVAFDLEPDSVGYDRIAVNLWQHGIFSQDQQAPFSADTVRTPVYPAFLATVYALVGHYPAAALAAQIVIASLASGLTYLIARELGLSTRRATIAGLAVALEPVSALMANVVLTDTFFATWLLTGLWALVRWNRTRSWKWLIVAAIGMGIAALTRPVGQYLPVALLVPIVVMTRRCSPRIPWRRVVTICLVFVMLSTGIMAGWSYRNYQERGIFTISTIGTTNLLYWRAADVYARAEGITLWQARERLESEVSDEVADQELGFAEKVALEQSRAVAILRAHPTLVLKQMMAGVARLMFGPGQTPACLMLCASPDDPACAEVNLGAMMRSMTLAPQLAVVWSVLLLGAVYLSATVGILSLLRQREWPILALLLMVAVYFIGVSAGADAYSRMRIPFFPLLAILCGFGLQRLAVLRMAERLGSAFRPWQRAGA